MPGIFLGTPTPVALPSDVDLWTSCQHTWTCDGQTWDLSSDASGVFLMAGVRGLNQMPPVVHYRQKAAAVNGARWKGFVLDQREVYWPLLVNNGDGSQAWLDHDARFWSTMQPDKTGVWTVTQPGDGSRAGESRSLTLRYESQADPPEEVAAELLGWLDYGVYLTAEQPAWAGPTRTQVWASAQEMNFYGGGAVGGHGYGPPFSIASGSSVQRATVDNPGDLPARLVWTMYGPSAAGTALGVAGRSIGVPFALQAGEWLRIDTAKTDQRALFGAGAQQIGGKWVIPATAVGTNRTRDLAASTRFGEVPPGRSVPLAINFTGQGAVQMDLTPLYYRDH